MDRCPNSRKTYEILSFLLIRIFEPKTPESSPGLLPPAIHSTGNPSWEDCICALFRWKVLVTWIFELRFFVWYLIFFGWIQENHSLPLSLASFNPVSAKNDTVVWYLLAVLRISNVKAKNFKREVMKSESSLGWPGGWSRWSLGFPRFVVDAVMRVPTLQIFSWSWEFPSYCHPCCSRIYWLYGH